ncbi:hypothetical protein CIG75_05415 [Tumebacillus algifaecis]|uniref:CRISPR type III-associated protein domain-containing protein n=1 Tax=Tumebacillus algifaecis TaxID=1214604 RepID=A0A223CZA8_9BACL|nr:RAMP superfamily CRISPR-associated protein [Tumebacillus algifaecis]ASS74486.1 hypothetical protein CIG75_05415 [Tumebacillus algifaecis]
MKPKVRLACQYRLQFQSAWLIGGTANQQGGVDAGYLTDFLGRPYLPGSTMKGKVRDSFRRLLSINPNWARHQQFLFGNAGQNTGQVYFQDALLDTAQIDDADWSHLYTRVAMDRYRKTVKDTAVITEKVVKPMLPLQGTLETFVQEEESEEIGLVLLLCLLDIKSIGSGASIGRGRIEMTYGVPTDMELARAEQSYCWLEVKQNESTEIWEWEHVKSLLQREQERQANAR